MSLIGNISGVSGTGNNIIDLAGSGSGELHGLRPSGTQTALFGIDPQTADRLDEWMLNVQAPQGWSFVSLFDEFWTFTSADAANTEVHLFDPLTQNLVWQTDLGFQVVGAAMPTCAPESSGS